MKHIYTRLVIIFVILSGSNSGSFAQTSTFTYTGSVVAYTVPAGATSLSITALGAQGGTVVPTPPVAHIPGNGAIINGTIAVVPGHVLNILVGGQPGTPVTKNAGGGGGSFVWDATVPAAPVILIAAGGGGGAGGGGNGIDASLTNDGTNGGAGAAYPDAGTGGNGGAVPISALPTLSYGAGGCGWLSNGANGSSGLLAMPPLAQGGDSPNPTVSPGTGAGGSGGSSAAAAGNGGFGGGGGGEASASSAAASVGGAGGGGGYSGGGGGASPTIAEGGGGGGSYCSGTVLSSSATNTGNGQVVITVLCGPGAITGNASLCVGSTEALVDTPSGGTWVSVNPAIATIDGGGNVTGIAPGTDTIYYIVLSDCGTVDTVSATLLVNASSSAGTISGMLTLCVGTTTTLSETLPGGTWSASNTNATVSGGLVSGFAVGMDTIYYTNSCGLATTSAVVTINPAPSAGTITGSSFTVCAGSSITLSDAAPGGTWSSSNTAIATVAGGTVTGVSAGSATISYTVTSPCGTVTATAIITVTPLPTAGTITGTFSACAGAASFTLSDGVIGGTWSSGSTAVATITAGPPGGVVSPVAAGTTTITYTVTNSCGTTTATQVITINTTPSAGTITGSSTACIGSAPITLTDAVAGGTWSASNTNATVAAGAVTAVATGTDTISYIVTNGCGSDTATFVVTINTAPATAGTITGTDSVCIGHSVTLTDGTAGGAWTCSNTKATVTGGIVTGVTAGQDTVIYTVSNTCGSVTATFPVKVKACPSEINMISTPAGLTIFPNPANDELTIKMNEGSFSSFTVTNSMGQVLMERQLNALQTNVNIKALPPAAIYYIIFRGETGTVIKTFVKM